MKPITFLCVLFSSFVAFSQQNDSIRLELVRIQGSKYFQPVHYANGFYRKPQFSQPKKNPGYFKSCILVQPVNLFNQDTTLRITALNSRFVHDKFYEIHTDSGIVAYLGLLNNSYMFYTRGYYALSQKAKDSLRQAFHFNWGSDTKIRQVYSGQYREYLPHKSEVLYIDSLHYVKQESEGRKHRNSLQPFVDSVLQPFYLSRYEVTNLQYRKFVNWVRDSLALRLLYDSLPEKQALRLLRVPKKEHPDPAKKAQNLARYGFNFELKPFEMQFEDSLVASYLSPFYYPQPERYYKRREIDSRKLVYRQASGAEIAIYPDTLTINQVFSDSLFSANPMTGMYFWHAGYDNYPVSGITPKQAMAYCSWLERQLAEKEPLTGYRYRVDLPQLYQYEMALKSCVPGYLRDEISCSPPAPFIYKRPDEEIVMNISAVNARAETHFHDKNHPYYFKFKRWEAAHTTSPVQNLLKGASELCRTSEGQFVILGGDASTVVLCPDELPYNSLFYSRPVAADEALPLSSFRPLIYLLPVK